MNSADVAQLYRNAGMKPPPEFADKQAMQSNKFGRRKKTLDGITFDSTLEANAYVVLKVWERVGKIRDLRLQPTFTLQETFKTSTGERVKSIRMVLDFAFFDVAQNRMCWVDTKGVITATFRQKVKMLKDRNPGVVVEVWDRQKVKELSR